MFILITWRSDSPLLNIPVNSHVILFIVLYQLFIFFYILLRYHKVSQNHRIIGGRIGGKNLLLRGIFE